MATRGLAEGGRKRLLMESAFAAVNYGLEAEIARLMDLLPLLLGSANDVKLCRAFMLFGLHRPEDAAACLEECAGADAHMLRHIVESETPDGQRRHAAVAAGRCR